VRTRDELVRLLEDSGMAYETIEAGSRWMIVAPSLAARIMGAGVGEENAFWLPPRVSLRGWSEGGNAGGQRSWIAPEGGPGGFFYSSDVSAWRVPPELDPGNYEPVQMAGGRRGYRSHLVARSADGSAWPIALSRSMSLGDEDEDHRWPASLRIQLRHELTNRGAELIDRRIGLWSILQLPCAEPGRVFFSLRTEARGGAAPLRAYFSPLPPAVSGAAGRLAWLNVMGGSKYKAGLPCADCAGVVAFLRRARLPAEAGRILLLTALKFEVDQTGLYLDKSSHSAAAAGENGDAAQAYNDPGRGELAFCEIEAHAPALRLAPGESGGADIDIHVALLRPDELQDYVTGRLGMAELPPAFSEG
jgi:hypothetical protein